MKTIRNIHLTYLLTIAAIVSISATFTARTMLTEIASPADITGVTPKIRLLDGDVADQDWEIEAHGSGSFGTRSDHFEISREGTATDSGMFKIHRNCDADTLTLDANGRIAVNRESATSFHEMEIFGNSGANDTFATLVITPGADDVSARITASSISDAFAVDVRNFGSSYTFPFVIDLDAPSNALVVDSSGDVGIGVARENMQPTANLHIADSSPEIFLDATSDENDWRISTGGGPSSGSIWFRKWDTGAVPVTFFSDAPEDSLVVDDLGVGLGTPLPDAPLHVFRDDGTAAFKVEETSGTVATRKMMELVNNGAALLTLENTDINKRWNLATNGNGHFVFTLSGTGGDEMRLSKVGEFSTGPGGFKALNSKPNGDLIIQGALTENSDREKKENFQAVDCDDVLAKVVDMEITTWNYKSNEETIRHMGPMAQDFHKAFALGRDDKTIAAMDKDGVALASIKALNKKLETKQAKIQQLERELAKNNQRLEALEQAISRIGQ